MSNIKYKKVISTKGIIFFVILIAICFTLSILSFTCYFDNTYKKTINYVTTSPVNYKVYLKENDYFDEPYLGMNRTYVASLINHVDIDFNYNLNFSNIVSGNYTYYIQATLKADIPDSEKNSSYWEKKYILKEEETVPFKKTNNINLVTSTSIDYQKYNDILKNFKRDLGLNFNGVLKVDLIVKSNSKTSNLKKDIPITSTTTVEIPLTQQTIDVSIKSVSNDKKSEVSETIDKSSFDQEKYLIIASISITIGLIFIIIFIRELRIKFKLSNKYFSELKKILSNYDQIIVDVNTFPNLDKVKVVEVDKFSELLDAHSEIRQPINHLEVNKNKHIFILIGDNIAYKYVLQNERRVYKSYE